MVDNHGTITIQLSLYIVIYHIFSPLRTGISGHHLVFRMTETRLLEPQLINVQALQSLELPLRLCARLGWRKTHQRKDGRTHWIGLRENFQETMVSTIKYRGFL